MTRGNQRDQARLKAQKKMQAAKGGTKLDGQSLKNKQESEAEVMRKKQEAAEARKREAAAEARKVADIKKAPDTQTKAVPAVISKGP